MRTKLFILGLLFAVFCFYSLSYSQVPQMINYQGKLTKPSGALLDTTVTVRFAIYGDTLGEPHDGAYWSETQFLNVKNGVFSVLLGSVNPIPDTVFTGEPRYLATKIGSDPEMKPLRPMASVPYALYAFKSLGGKGDGDWFVNGNDMYSIPSGNVGIGTDNPTGKLHVKGVTGAVKLEAEPNLYSDIVFTDPSSPGSGLRNWCIRAHAGNPTYGRALEMWSVAGGPLDILNCNVGIGTTTPMNKLDVEGGVAVGTGYSGTNTAPTNGMIVEGNVGIGTTVPAAKLHIGDPFTPGPAPSNIGVLAKIAGPTSPALGSATKWGIVGYAETGGVLGSGNMYGIYGITYGTDNLSVGVYGEGGGGASWAGKFGGKVYAAEVAIGTTTPMNKLDVEGSVAVGAGYSGTNTAPTNGMIVEGNVGIGNTDPQAKLEVGDGYLSNLQGTVIGHGHSVFPDGIAPTDGVIGIMHSQWGHIAGSGVLGIVLGAEGIGVRGEGPVGVSGKGAKAVWGEAYDANYIWGSTVGVYGKAGTASSGPPDMPSYGIYGKGAGVNTYGVYSAGDARVQGTLTVTGNVGIGTTNPQGALDVSSTTGALIVPRMTTGQRDALTPVNGMIIYNTTTNQFNFYENGAWVAK